MDKVNIYFSINIVFFVGLMVFVCVGSPILLSPLFIHAVKTENGGAIIFLIILFCMSLIALPFCFIIMKCFIALIKKQPAIEMTPHYYIDNVEHIKIPWNNISDIYILELRNSFLKVAVIDDEIVYAQAKKPIYRYIFRSNASNGGILSINLSFLKGKNIDIVNSIEDYYQKAIKL